jgi:pimeloyl-ACP methyl ester carboxylesterase
VIPPEVLTAMAAKLCAQLGPRTWIRFTDTYLATPDLPVARVRTPVLVVGGDHDPAAAPSDARALADRLPDARLRMLPDCGHFAMVEQPAPFADLVGDFLGATCGGAGPAGD